MLHVQTLVAAVDFSPASADATRHAAALAGRAGAVLHLLHADVLFHASGDGTPQAVPSGHLRLRLERFADETLGADHGACLAVERDVAVPAALARYAAAVRADLLVIGSHGRGRIARMLLGSVAEAVVADPPCAVLTIPAGGADPAGPGAPVLVAVDFSERSRDALAAGGALATLTGARLELAHAVRGSGPYPGIAPNVFSLWDVDPAQADAVRSRLLRLAAEGPLGGVPVAATHVVFGPPGRGVPEVAADRGAGLLVVGTHGRGDLARAVLGSVARTAVRRAPCPVLTVARAQPAKPAGTRPADPSSSD